MVPSFQIAHGFLIQTVALAEELLKYGVVQRSSIQNILNARIVSGKG